MFYFSGGPSLLRLRFAEFFSPALRVPEPLYKQTKSKRKYKADSVKAAKTIKTAATASATATSGTAIPLTVGEKKDLSDDYIESMAPLWIAYLTGVWMTTAPELRKGIRARLIL